MTRNNLAHVPCQTSATGEGTVTATSDADELVAANPTRRFLLVQNKGANPAYLAFTGAATTAGLLLPASSAPTVLLDVVVLDNAISVIAPSGDTDIYYLEG